METKRGSVNKIVVDALIEKGYEIVSNPKINDQGNIIEDVIDIYRISDYL